MSDSASISRSRPTSPAQEAPVLIPTAQFLARIHDASEDVSHLGSRLKGEARNEYASAEVLEREGGLKARYAELQGRVSEITRDAPRVQPETVRAAVSRTATATDVEALNRSCNALGSRVARLDRELELRNRAQVALYGKIPGEGLALAAELRNRAEQVSSEYDKIPVRDLTTSLRMFVPPMIRSATERAEALETIAQLTTERAARTQAYEQGVLTRKGNIDKNTAEHSQLQRQVAEKSALIDNMQATPELQALKLKFAEDMGRLEAARGPAQEEALSTAATLKHEVERLTALIAEKDEEVATAKKEFAEEQQKLLAEKAKAEAGLKALNEKDPKFAELVSKREKAIAALAAIDDKIKAARADAETAATAVTGFEDGHAKLHAELSQRIANAERELQALAAQPAVDPVAAAALKKQLEAQLVEWQTRHEANQTSLKAKKADAETRLGAIQGPFEEELAAAREAVAQVEAEMAAFHEENDDRIAELQDENPEVNPRLQIRQRLQREEATYNALMERLEQDRDRLAAEKEELETRLNAALPATLKRNIDEQEGIIADAEAAIAEEPETRDKRIAGVQKQIDALDAELAKQKILHEEAASAHTRKVAELEPKVEKAKLDAKAAELAVEGKKEQELLAAQEAVRKANAELANLSRQLTQANQAHEAETAAYNGRILNEHTQQVALLRRSIEQHTKRCELNIEAHQTKIRVAQQHLENTFYPRRDKIAQKAQEAVAANREALAEVDDKIASAEQAFTALSDELVAEFNGLNAEFNALLDKYNQIDARQKQAVQELADLEVDTNPTAQEIHKLGQTIEECEQTLEADVTSFRQAAASQAAKIEEAGRMATQGAQAVDAKKSSLTAEREAAIAELHKIVTGHDARLASLQQASAQAAEAAAKLASSLADEAGTLHTTIMTLSAQIAEVDGLNKQAGLAAQAALEDAVRALQQQVADHQEALAGIAAERQELVGHLAASKRELEPRALALQQQYEQIVRDLEACQKTFAAESAKLNQATDAATAQPRAELAAMQQRVEQLDAAYEAARADLRTFEEQQTDQLRALEVQIDSANQLFAYHQDAAARFTRHVAGLTERFKAVDAERAAKAELAQKEAQAKAEEELRARRAEEEQAQAQFAQAYKFALARLGEVEITLSDSDMSLAPAAQLSKLVAEMNKAGEKASPAAIAQWKQVLRVLPEQFLVEIASKVPGEGSLFANLGALKAAVQGCSAYPAARRGHVGSRFGSEQVSSPALDMPVKPLIPTRKAGSRFSDQTAEQTSESPSKPAAAPARKAGDRFGDVALSAPAASEMQRSSKRTGPVVSMGSRFSAAAASSQVEAAHKSSKVVALRQPGQRFEEDSIPSAPSSKPAASPAKKVEAELAAQAEQVRRLQELEVQRQAELARAASMSRSMRDASASVSVSASASSLSARAPTQEEITHFLEKAKAELLASTKISDKFAYLMIGLQLAAEAPADADRNALVFSAIKTAGVPGRVMRDAWFEQLAPKGEKNPVAWAQKNIGAHIRELIELVKAQGDKVDKDEQAAETQAQKRKAQQQPKSERSAAPVSRRFESDSEVSLSAPASARSADAGKLMELAGQLSLISKNASATARNDMAHQILSAAKLSEETTRTLFVSLAAKSGQSASKAVAFATANLGADIEALVSVVKAQAQVGGQEERRPARRVAGNRFADVEASAAQQESSKVKIPTAPRAAAGARFAESDKQGTSAEKTASAKPKSGPSITIGSRFSNGAGDQAKAAAV